MENLELLQKVANAVQQMARHLEQQQKLLEQQDQRIALLEARNTMKDRVSEIIDVRPH
mgnify:CR=1 FL=1|jgi:cytochrome P450